ncbi:unnamed protein product [Calypogeia fissa]
MAAGSLLAAKVEGLLTVDYYGSAKVVESAVRALRELLIRLSVTQVSAASASGPIHQGPWVFKKRKCSRIGKVEFAVLHYGGASQGRWHGVFLDILHDIVNYLVHYCKALDATQKLSWDASNWFLFNDRHTTSTPEGKENFENFKLIMRMVINFPLKLPGTAYTVGMKARTALMAYFRKLIDERRGSTESVYFAALLAGRDDPDCREQLKDFDDNVLAENIFLLNFTAHDTNSMTLLWILKFLVDYPDVFRRLQAEQQEILNSKDRSVKGLRLTWEDMRKMVYRHKFLRELQRFISLVPANFAEANEDVKFGDYLIPKGWMVITLTNVIHNDPANYPDLSFNPDRFDVIPKPFTYLPFSGGPHMCPGIEFAMLVGCIFIHHITTTYMHDERAGRDKGLEYDGFFPRPKGGYPINFRAGKFCVFLLQCVRV